MRTYIKQKVIFLVLLPLCSEDRIAPEGRHAGRSKNSCAIAGRKQAHDGRGYEAGFTLMEVLIAFAIVSLSFVLIMQLFAGGLRASRTSCDYTRAVVYAKDKMGELSENPLEGDGEFEDGFKWQAVVETYKEFEETTYNLMKLKVIVTWNDGARKERKVEFVSLKAVDSEESL